MIFLRLIKASREQFYIDILFFLIDREGWAKHIILFIAVTCTMETHHLFPIH